MSVLIELISLYVVIFRILFTTSAEQLFFSLILLSKPCSELSSSVVTKQSCLKELYLGKEQLHDGLSQAMFTIEVLSANLFISTLQYQH